MRNPAASITPHPWSPAMAWCVLLAASALSPVYAGQRPQPGQVAVATGAASSTQTTHQAAPVLSVAPSAQTTRPMGMRSNRSWEEAIMLGLTLSGVLVLADRVGQRPGTGRRHKAPPPHQDQPATPP